MRPMRWGWSAPIRRMTTNGHPGAKLDLAQLATKNGFPLPSPDHAHTCRACGAPVDCEWKTLAESESAARSVLAIANRIKLKFLGLPSGRQRNQEFTEEEARRLLAELGSYRAVARRLGVSQNTVTRAVLPRDQWPASFASVRERRERAQA